MTSRWFPSSSDFEQGGYVHAVLPKLESTLGSIMACSPGDKKASRTAGEIPISEAPHAASHCGYGKGARGSGGGKMQSSSVGSFFSSIPI